MQKVRFSKKNLFTSWIQTRDLLHVSQLLYPLAICALVFNGMLLKFSPLLCLQLTAEHKLITTLTCSDKLEVGGSWVYAVRHMNCRYQQS